MTVNPTPTYPVTCPACSKVGNSTRPIPQGVKVRCKCGHSFVPTSMVIEDVFDIALPPLPDPSTLPDDVSVADLEGGLAEDRLGVEREATLTDIWIALNLISRGLTPLASSQPSVVNAPAPREYKVITQKDKWFSGKFDPDKVEGALNSHAKQGWTLKGVATASVPGFGGQRDEIVIIMER